MTSKNISAIDISWCAQFNKKKGGDLEKSLKMETTFLQMNPLYLNEYLFFICLDSLIIWCFV